MPDSSSIRAPFMPMIFMVFVRTDLRRYAEDQEEFERKWVTIQPG